jgi:hypothetical protein
MKIRSSWKVRFGTAPRVLGAKEEGRDKLPYVRVGWNPEAPVPPEYHEPPTITTVRCDPTQKSKPEWTYSKYQREVEARLDNEAREKFSSLERLKGSE